MPTYDPVEDTALTVSANANNVSNWTADDIRKSDILVFRESATEYVDTVVAPNGFQVGLLDEAFLTDLLVTGHITGSGVIYSELGFSGSLQTLIDGSNYLVGAGGISITNNENGSITISGGGSGGAGSRIKANITPSGTVSAGTVIPATGVPLATYTYSANLIDVFLNGDLLLQGTQSDVNAGNADFYLENDVSGNGQLKFRYDVTNQDELILIAGTVGSGGGGGGTTYTAGQGMSLVGTQFKSKPDTTTIGFNSSDELEVLRVPGSITSGNGINTLSYNGSGNASISVKTVSGGPVTVTGAGIGLDFTPLSAVSLAGTDEVIVSKGGAIGKTTVSDIVAMASGGSGAPTTAAYLVATASSSLSNERVLVGTNGVTVTDGGANNQMTVSAAVKNNGGVEIVSGELAVKIADFIGFGLTDNGGSIDVNLNALAGTGLTVSGTTLAIDFSQVASPNNEIEINAGDGLSLGGTARIGDASSTVNLEVASSALKGVGMSVSNNNLDLYIKGTGGITITSGSADGNGVPIIIDGSNLGGGGSGGSSGNIGPAEDGSYTDGLFKDFTDTTPIGTPIDRFNEMLSLLAPSPAPDISSINSTVSNGISTKLSFGLSNTGGSAYIDSSTDGGMTAIDTNGTYEAATQGTSVRLGVYTTAINIEGIVNHHVAGETYSNSAVNYVDDSYGNGEVGTLKLFVNNMTTPIHSVDLASFVGAGNPGSGTSPSFTSNSGFYDVSITKDATSSEGKLFTIFKHRTSKYRIHTGHQREGWNYAKVVHTIGTTNKTTNYIEWVNDTDTTAISASSTSITNIVGSDIFVLSGIQYFKTSSFDYGTTIANTHRGIHTGTPINFNSTYGSITAATDQNSVNLLSVFPSVESGEDYTKSIVVSASGTFNVNSSGFPAGGLLNGSNTVSVDVVHPNTNKNQSALGSSVMSGLLMWYTTSASTELSEDFNSEAWRMQSGSYNTQAAVYTSSSFVTPWDSSIHVNSSNVGHNTGLVQYQGQLRAPRNTLLNGDFASITNAPGSNANYSTITSGDREYIRAFKKTDAGSVRDIRLTLDGDATIVANGATLSGNQIKVFIKLPGTTGWMDLHGTFALGSNGDNDGAHVSTFTAGISGSVNNYASFGIDTISQNEYVLVKILADAGWTGNLSSMTVKFGASSGDETSVPDSCSSINSTTSNGIDAKLSFGATQSIPASDANHPYENVAGSNSLTTVDINTLYSAGANRKGIYDGTAILTGIVNADEAGDTDNFVPYAIRYGNEGTIKLYVNDALKHSIDLSVYSGTGNPGSGTALGANSAGSGFSNISTAQYVTWSDGIPDFRYNIRTMNWRVVAADQRDGHNWVKVVHTVSSTDYETTYIEWVNDTNGDSVTFSNVDLADFTDGDTSYLSGIQYFNSPSSTMKYRVANLQRNIYSSATDALGFIGLTNVSITNLEITGAGVQDPTDVNTIRTTIPPILTNSDTNYTIPMDVTGSFNYTPSKTLPGTYGTSANNVTINTKAYHPLSNPSGATQAASKNNFLVWTPTQSGSSNLQSIEDFSGESYRIQDTTYSITTDITNNSWNSQESVVGSNAGHNTGLVIYNGNLIRPSAAGNSGDFSTGLQGPSGNVDYSLSNVSNNTRTYLRAFYNPNGDDSASNLVLSMTGNASLVSDGGPSNSGTLGANTNIYIKVKLVYHNAESTKTTGWLDAGEQATGGNSDGQGCSGESLSSLNVVWNNNTQTVQINYPTGRGLYGSSSPFNRNYMIIKIETHKEWTGKFTDMRITSYT